MNLSVRKAFPEDAAFCANIHKRSWLYAYTHCLGEEFILQRHKGREAVWKIMLTSPENDNYVAVLNGKIIGIISIGKERDGDMPANTGELCGFYLDPDYIGKGYGRKAMDWVKQELFSRGYNSVVVWVLDENRRAKRFYLKNGFVPEGTVKPSGLKNTMEERYILRTED